MQAPKQHAFEEARSETIETFELVSEDHDEMFDGVVRLISAALDVPICAFSVVHEDRQFFKAIEGLGVRETPRDVSFCGHVVAADENMMVVEDALLDKRFADNPLVTGDPSIRFYAGALVRAPNSLSVGTICAIDRKPRKFSDAQLRLLQDGRNMLELALLLRQQSILDRHTGLFNRRYFDDHIAREWKRAFQKMGSISVLLIDIDRFHEYNSAYGHELGDKALGRIGDALRGELRRTGDLASRYSGGEFAVVLPDTDLAMARTIAGRICDKVYALDIAHGGSEHRRLTVSVGGATATERSDLARGFSANFQIAGDALHDAKDAGRNAVIVRPVSETLADLTN